MVKANTTIVEDTIGQVVALNSLPNTKAEGDIKGKVIDALGDDLRGKDGLKKLLKWMDEHMGSPVLCGQSLRLHEVQEDGEPEHEGVSGRVRRQVQGSHRGTWETWAKSF